MPGAPSDAAGSLYAVLGRVCVCVIVCVCKFSAQCLALGLPRMLLGMLFFITLGCLSVGLRVQAYKRVQPTARAPKQERLWHTRWVPLKFKSLRKIRSLSDPFLPSLGAPCSAAMLRGTLRTVPPSQVRAHHGHYCSDCFHIALCCTGVGACWGYSPCARKACSRSCRFSSVGCGNPPLAMRPV